MAGQRKKEKKMNLSATEFAQDLIRFVDASPTPYHAIQETKRRLQEAGFQELKESERWFLKGRKYYAVRGGTSLIAFIIGSETPALYNGFKIVGAHTDSPNLKLKPNYAYTQTGYLQFGVEPYGGGVWRTWLDRDLHVAGRIVFRAPDGRLFSRLANMENVTVSIPGLAIHLDREVNENGAINNQTDLPAIVSLENVDSDTFNRWLLGPGLPADTKIVSTALSLCDNQNGTLSGFHNEFIRSGRLDDLASCHQAITALVNTEGSRETCVVSLCDHEEVGSGSAQGANGPFLKNTLERIAEMMGITNVSDFQRALSKSFCISSDMAHAAHPNHPRKEEPRHIIKIGGGPVIKWNADQRYATTDVSAAIFANVCDIAGVQYQTFVSRSDARCGSTIGPITAKELGIPAVDVGIPMLAMHSIREQCGVNDHFAMEKAFETFFSREREEITEL
jgi:aspartyl aminopeptidase